MSWIKVVILLVAFSGISAWKRQSSRRSRHITMKKETIKDKDIIHFMQKGHLYKSQIISSASLQALLPAAEAFLSENLLVTLKHKVEVTLGVEDTSKLTLQECQEMLSTVDSTYIPFLQLFNVWRKVPAARAVSINQNLGKIAAQLLGVDAVRLYQDSLFIKRPGDGPTQWHTDLNMAPFDSNDLLTCWIPLMSVPTVEAGGSSLLYASGSHKDFALPYWYSIDDKELDDRYEVTSYGPFAVGDCAFHHGWTLHSAPGNEGDTTRIAYAVTFVKDKAPLLTGKAQYRYPDEEDTHSYSEWIGEVGWGGVADHPLLPLVYSARDTGGESILQ